MLNFRIKSMLLPRTIVLGSIGKEVSFQWITANLFENRKSYLFLFGFPADRVLVCQRLLQEGRMKKMAAGHLFNNNPPRPAVVSVCLHFFPSVLFLPINFCLISRETGQKVIITADPAQVKNVIIKLGSKASQVVAWHHHTPKEREQCKFANILI